MVNVGNSIIALKYSGGILIGGDTGVTYGSMKNIKRFQRVSHLGTEGLFACSGEMSDFQNL